MSRARALVLTGYGLNCDNETKYALELAGADAQRVHINSLIDGKVPTDDFRIMVFGGGFGWGDDHGGGVIQALKMKTHLGGKITEFVQKGGLILGICNGFQALVNLGLLPGFQGDYTKRSVALTFNDCGNFRDQWVDLTVNKNSPCVFTKGIETLSLPVRHGEGKFYAGGDVIDRLERENLVVMRYALPGGGPAGGAFPYNPNGSLGDIAGICDPTGRIFGLMPHPEAFNHNSNHPDWTRIREEAKRKGKIREFGGLTTALKIFKNAVDFLLRG